MKNIKPLPLLFLTFILPACCFAQIQFTENKGQWEKQVAFKTDLKAGAFFIEKNGFAIVKHNEEELEKISGHSHSNEPLKNSTTTQVIHSHAIKVKFVGASASSIAEPGKAMDSYSNYFTGNDKSKWKGNCKIYEEVIYKNVYPNIDVRYYSNAGAVKYDFILHPGADIHKIVLKYEGADGLEIKDNELHIATSVGYIKESFPYSYQLINGERKKVDCNYATSGNKVLFDIKQYDKRSILVIDPAIIFCSFVGSTIDNWGNTGAPGPDGSFFAAGLIFGTGYPVSAGAFSQTFNGGTNEDSNGPYDIGIFKFSSNGANRLYATYLGGNGNEQPSSMLPDAQGNLILLGRTSSSNYPTTAMIGSGGGYDIVVTRFNAAGTALLGSVKMGGSGNDGINIKAKYTPLGVPGQTDGAYDTRRNYSDDCRGDLLLDNDNNIYIAGSTQSTNFPVIGSSIQPVFGGGGTYIQQDGFVAKLNSNLTSVLFSTFLGGSGNDACFNLALNSSSGNLYVSGATTSTNLPGDRSNTLSTFFSGGATDGFISILKSDGSGIVKTTYDGTAGNDMIYGMQLDRKGYVYITGTTTGNRSIVNAAFSETGGKQFISKINADLSAYVYSTNFGTNAAVPNICPLAFYVDKCENVYVSGWGGVFLTSKQYPNSGTTGLTVTSNALQPTTDGNDFYFFVLQRNASAQLYGSFFGQNGGFTDHADGSSSRFDNNGILYQAICGNCGNTPGVTFPTTPGAWATTNLSSGCNQAVVKVDLNFGSNAVLSAVKATEGGIAKDTVCNGSTILFSDTIANAKKYTWNFGDGTPELVYYAPANNSAHTFNLIGTLRVRLTSSDSLSCNLADTSYKTITIKNCADTQFCNSGNLSISSSVSGATYQWQWIRPDYPYFETNYTNLNDNATFTGSNNKTLQLANAPTNWYGYKLRCMVDGISYSNIAVLKFAAYWTGLVSDQWEVDGNWSCGKIPDANTDVFVNNAIRSPFITSYPTVRSITLGAGAAVNVRSGFSLTITH